MTSADALPKSYFFLKGMPGERIYILITWTPLEGGKVRELITFIVNDVVKLQAVLLGNAEQPIKKKKNLWDTIKRRPPAQQLRKRVPVVKSINKTFQVSEKTEKNRSPLQSCENLEVNSNRISPNGNSLIISEHNLSLSPINPVSQKNQHVFYTPLSTTYSIPEAPACHKLLNNVTETPTVTTLCANVLGENVCQYNINSAEINAKSVGTPEQLNMSLNRRKILSPDSFINNSYEVTEDAAIAMPILSPDQFLKENQMVVQPISECKTVSFSSDVKSCMSTAKVSKQKEKVQVAFFIEPQLSTKTPNNINEKNPTTRCYKKIEQNVKSKTSDQACCLQSKIKPLLSSTATKTKPNPEGKEAKMLKLKSKKSLSNAIEHCTDIIPKNLDILPRLPVIESVSNETKCIKDKSGFIYLESSHNRKRKSGEYLEDVNGKEEYAENLGRKRTLVSNDENGSKNALKLAVSKSQNGDKQKKRFGSSSKKYKNFKRTKNIVPVAQSHLTFVKPLKAGNIPRHPMPFAAKNMFYDEQWKEKQQRGFTWWLNFVLTPDDFTLKTDVSQVNTACLILGTETYKTSVPKAPTKEEASLRAYTTRCKLNKLRRSSFRLFTCDEMMKAIKRLEIEIEAKRLLVRKDRHLWKDIGERQKILSWLLCYNPLWLRIGLETIFGELIALESNSDMMGLAVFILNRLLWNPVIAAEYRHPTVPHLYRDGHEEALSKFTLKKLLLLVCFLDRAKVSRIIEHDPCLFFKNAEYKSSKEILLAFSRDFLSGEGDLSRHLGFMGFPVNHVQTTLDEFDFGVTNLATDLQCGIRLVRTLELLSSDWTLSKKLRVPAISRLQKMHNVKLAFEALNAHGIQLKDELGSTIDAKDIVDRHREKTFALLWKIVFAFQVNISLDVNQLKAEIAFLKNMQVRKLKRPDVECVNSMGYETSMSYSYESYGENVKLLMDWVNVVCGFYNIKVENFTVSFSDGRVLCYLIHHYHPCYVPLDAVCKHTTQTVECTRSGTLGLNSSSESDSSLNLKIDQTISTSVLYKELLDNEKRNFQLINAAVSDLGGIPAMIQHSDMSNTIPDEKVVIIYVSFLCSRLISLSKEIRAAQLIQSAWRKYRLKILAETKEQKFNAVIVLQKHWRRYLAVLEFQKLKKAKQEETARIAIQRRQEAVIVLQAWYRMKRERQRFLKMSGAASVIQAYYHAHRERTFQRQKFLQIKRAILHLQASYRGFKVRRMLRHQHMAATKIQALYRAYAARMKYQSLIQASIVIQKWYRTSKSGSKIRKRFQKTKAAVISLQAVLRGWQVRKWLQKQHAAAITIQSAYRKYKAMKKFRIMRHSAITIQQHYRAHMSSKKQQQEYIVLYNSIVLFQATWRGTIVRRQIERQHQAAVTIQSYYRMHVNQAKFKHFRKAAVTIQRWYRAVIQARNSRQKYLTLKETTLKMQAIYRGLRERRKIQRMNQAAICIQAMFKMHQCNVQYRTLKKSAIIIQTRCRAFCRGQEDRKKYLALRKSSLILQAAYRGMKIRQELRSSHQCIIVIQSYYRMYRERKAYLKLVAAIKVIQRWYRASRDTNAQMYEYKMMKISALKIQAAFRGMKTRVLLKKMHMAAIIIQRNFKAFLQRRTFIFLKSAAVTIQRRYRATVLSKQQREKFLNLRRAVIIIQSAIRGLLVRRHVKQMHLAAAVIQATFGMHIAYTQYRRMKSACVVIQQHYRAYQAAKQTRELYLKQQRSALILQAAYRGMKVRHMLKKKHEAAVVIQSNYRKHRQWKSYKNIQWAARLIQVRVRANQASKMAVQQYSSIRKATICIQKAFRRMKARNQRRQEAALLLQQSFKRQRARKNDLALKAAAISLQRRYRATVLSKQQRENFLNLRRAVIIIQSAIRGLLVRRHVKQMHLAAAVIQATFRMHITYTQYRTMKSACVVIQQHYRAYQAAKQTRELYLKQQRSALILQAAYRGMKVRHMLKKKHEAAVVIQSNYRKHRQWKSYKNIQWAARLIQVRVRANQASKMAVQQYSSIRKATICIQKAFRRMKARNQRRQVAAILLQRSFKRQRARKNYLALKAAANFLQRKYRATVLSKQQHEKFLNLRRAVIIIQSGIRGLLVRRHVKQMHLAAAVIQATFRMRITYTQYRTMKSACVVIQHHYRAYQAAKQTKELYLKQQHSALILQAAYRGMKVRHMLKKKHEAAVVIQSNYRKHRQWKSYKNIQWAARLIQVRVRANQASKMAVQQYSSIKKATICIQKAFRRMKARNQRRQEAAILLQRSFKRQRERKNYLALKAAANFLQRKYRATVLSKQQHGNFLNLRRAVIIIQSGIRGLLVRRHVKQMHLAAAVIQATFRMHITYTQYRTMKSACVVIQQHYRAYQAAKQTKELYLKQNRSALILQAAYRGMKVRNMLKKKHEAAVVIQSNYRKHRQWKSYKSIQWAVRLIQVRVRANQASKMAVQQYSSIRKATICIQKAFRRMKARNQSRQEAALLLQRSFKRQRAIEAKEQYQKYWKAAVLIQQHYRSYMTMKHHSTVYLQTCKRIIILQATVRGFIERQRFSRVKRSTIKIQRWFRGNWQRRKYLQYRRNIIIIQRMVRRWISHRNTNTGGIPKDITPQNVNTGVIKFQALWRGYSWRKKTDTPETRSLRDSLIIANKESKEENKLYNRTAVAIDNLLKYKHFSYILVALKDLEIVTRLSPVCCENMAQSKAVCTIFTLIRSCNRSVPSMDVIKYSVQVLLNLSKYEKTADAVYSVKNSVETLLDLLQMYREKSGDKTSKKTGSIFTKTCCLFAHLSKDSRRASEIQNNHKTVARLRRLFKVTARKHQMDVQRMRAKQSSIPVKTKIVSRQRPDWDLRKDNIREIVDPLQAIEMVVNTLGISYD
ncbi:abnormal spindle-like microcephaly-associated protein homolog isoform X2 [Erythrolamprus reginae]|uniref:abnormal spindle-like microcephaly-associated protein homolog isoform X2 n=1 Tax=Erythrolamprus reginae TaxID=121349 RepID=UPI00396C64A8